MNQENRFYRFTRGSWKTTMLGSGMILYSVCITVLAVVYSTLDDLSIWDISALMFCLLGGAGLIFARDDDTTSGDARASRKPYHRLPSWLLLVGFLFAEGCVDVRMPNAIENVQFAYLVEAVEEQAVERPPETPREAGRLTSMRKVAIQGVQLTRVELKHKGAPDGVVPSPLDHAAVHHETKAYEEDVDAEIAIRGMIESFIPAPIKGLLTLPNVLGGGSVGAIVTGLLGLLHNRKKLTKDITSKRAALGQMFKLAGENVEKDKLSKVMEGTEAQIEFRVQREEKRNGRVG